MDAEQRKIEVNESGESVPEMGLGVRLLEDLNEPQRKAVEAPDGPLLILAGAGSGKTRVITHRIAFLLAQRKVDPRNILAVTFTNKAAEEMAARVWRLVGSLRRGLWIGTFHSVCSRILRQECDRIGFDRNFVIYDEDDQSRLIKECLSRLNLGASGPNPGLLLNRISRAKNQMIGPEAYVAEADESFEELIAKVYRLYQRLLKEHNAFDFDDLIMATANLFQAHPEVLNRYQDRFRYIMVDEYQDTNHAQYRFVSLLAGEKGNLCVVGDDDQSIYGWRGADIRNILSFEQDFPQATVVLLEENYRSTKNILRAANHLVKHNLGRKDKDLWTAREGGENLRLFQALDERAEARFVVGEILRLRGQEGRTINDFALFYRTNAQSRVFEEELRREDLPYTVIGGVGFYRRREVKDALAYLRLIANPRDEISLRRIINVPSRKIGKVTIRKVSDFATSRGMPMYEALGLCDEIESLSGRARKSIGQFCGFINEIIEQRDALSVRELLERVLEESGYLDALRDEPGSEPRLENLAELVSAAKEFDDSSEDGSLSAFLQGISLMCDVDEWDDAQPTVTLLTIHSAKGLEFPVVFLTGLEEELFPHFSSFGDHDELEEERRLCYVAITRAKDQLYLSCAAQRMLHGKRASREPSRFLGELPLEIIDVVDSEGIPRFEGWETVTEVPQVSQDFPVGQYVVHPRWGLGKIVHRSGTREALKVQVRFDRDNVERDLMVKYAGLRRANV